MNLDAIKGARSLIGALGDFFDAYRQRLVDSATGAKLKRRYRKRLGFDFSKCMMVSRFSYRSDRLPRHKVLTLFVGIRPQPERAGQPPLLQRRLARSVNPNDEPKPERQPKSRNRKRAHCHAVKQTYGHQRERDEIDSVVFGNQKTTGP